MIAGGKAAGRWRLVGRLPTGILVLWLAASVLAPLLIVLKISLSESAFAQPPYRPQLPPTLDAARWLDALRQFGLASYATLWRDGLYWRAALTSVALAAGSTAFLIAIGYPAALAVARAPTRWRPALLALVIVPFWTSFLVRVYAWIAILKTDGWLNALLLKLGLVAEPLAILDTNAAVVIGMVHAYLPFMILPVYAALERQDAALAEAASDLGAGPLRLFWTVTWPLSRPGVAAGAILCFVPMLGEFVIPDLLGGSDTITVGRALWSEFFSNRDWPLASAVAIVLVVVIAAPALLYRRCGEALRG